MKKKKILVLVDWFAPGYKAGGPIQSCVNFAFAMKDKYEVYVLTTDTDHGDTSPYEGIPTGRWTNHLHPDISVFYMKRQGLKLSALEQQMKELDADYIYLNHLFSPRFVVWPLWLKFLGRLKSEIVLCPRGALYDSALSVKPWKKTPFLHLFKWMGIHRRILFHATNEREKAAILRFFPRSHVRIADNLPKMDQRPYIPVTKEPGLVKCIFISRIVSIKNLLFFLRALEKAGCRAELTIVGPVEDPVYWDECRKKIEHLPSNISVQYVGPKQNNELPDLIRQHHLYVLPTTGENFGHSIFEALLAGRPVLISDQTPWLGLEARKTGWDLPIADSTAFTDIVEKVADWDQATFDEWGQAAWTYAQAFIQNPGLHDQYAQLFP